VQSAVPFLQNTTKKYNIYRYAQVRQSASARDAERAIRKERESKHKDI